MNSRYLPLVSLTVLALLAGCGGGGGSDGNNSPPTGSTPPPTTPPPTTPPPTTPPPPPPFSASVAGAVQKGPFLVGSTVLVNKLDNLGQPTDSTIVTQIRDSVGSFTFSPTSTGPVQIVATGYYFSELTGQISGGTLTLRGIYDVDTASTQTAYVNIMTHLIHNRVLALVGTGVTLTNAIAQAQQEFVTAFASALPTANLGQFSAMSVYNSTGTSDAANAYLLALSTGFYKYAATLSQQMGTTPDAELTLALNRISADFAEDGTLQTAGFINDFIRAIRSLSPTEIADNLRRRSIADYPAGLDVPNISRFLNQCAGATECAWRSGAAMPAPSKGHATAEFGGKLYVFGGDTSADTWTGLEPPPGLHRSARAYDPVSNSWTALPPMPVGAFDLSAQAIGNKIYVVMGYDSDGGFRNELMEYDPQAGTWTQKAPNPTYRYQFITAVVNGRLYVIAGTGTIDDGPWESGKPWSRKDRVSIYDPGTDTWSQGQSAPVTVEDATGCSFGDKIYMFGGRDDSGLVSTTLEYDTTSNSWSTKAPLPLAKEGHECVRVNDQFYVFGGRNASGIALEAVDRYDPTTDTWTNVTRLPTPRFAVDAAAIGGEIFIPGGKPNPSGTHYTDVLEILNPLL